MAFSHSAEYAVQLKCIFVKFSLQSPFIFRTHLSDPQLFQNCDLFQYYVSLNQNKVSWCIIENDPNFERNEDRATVFIKWTDLVTILKALLAMFCVLGWNFFITVNVCQNDMSLGLCVVNKLQVHAFLFPFWKT